MTLLTGLFFAAAMSKDSPAAGDANISNEAHLESIFAIFAQQLGASLVCEWG
eukprot:CAMPEP_0176090472 /NCGR_PEP_ID=MMETSP0120_2-20121206/45310_1 /TAXON_ID=160619 /ORGANISM="Kryptoperidinium foliaceum, Strain CCMP 1326" /LENGTH=51 /DNA_ID=CAMNT_0017424353 /DNA_START=73 /DNA_END=225 /DNA_ORIENTATION=-